MCKSYSRYSKKLKLTAVKTYLNSDISAELLAKNLGVKSDTQILEWVKKYKELGEIAFDRKRKIIIKTEMTETEKKRRSLKKENEHLKMENEYLKKLYILQKQERGIMQ